MPKEVKKKKSKVVKTAWGGTDDKIVEQFEKDRKLNNKENKKSGEKND